MTWLRHEEDAISPSERSASEMRVEELTQTSRTILRNSPLAHRAAVTSSSSSRYFICFQGATNSRSHWRCVGEEGFSCSLKDDFQKDGKSAIKDGSFV